MKEILFQVFITTLELVCLSQIFIPTMLEFSLNSIIHVCYDLSLRVIHKYLLNICTLNICTNLRF